MLIFTSGCFPKYLQVIKAYRTESFAKFHFVSNECDYIIYYLTQDTLSGKGASVNNYAQTTGINWDCPKETGTYVRCPVKRCVLAREGCALALQSNPSTPSHRVIFFFF